MSAGNISSEWIQKQFKVLERIGNLGMKREDGFLRASWSAEETRAMTHIKIIAQAAGLVGDWDAVGNLFITTPGNQEREVMTGSHLDTVPGGGNYDGAAGVVCGLAAIIALKDKWPSLKKRLALVVWRGEESACFTAVCKGSQAAFGLNDPNILQRKFKGITLEEAIRGQGFDPAPIAEKRATLDSARVDAIAALVELHIEQAKMLEMHKKPIGLVTSIRGTIRIRVEVTGEANHSGGTPMGITYRKDANLAMAYMQVGMDTLGKEALAQGKDLVQTVGVINTSSDFNETHPMVAENAITKVSPYGYFMLDIRSDDEVFLAEHAAKVEALIEKTGKDFNVEVSMGRLMDLKPVECLDEKIVSIEKSVCAKNGIDYELMPSGAIHDAVVVANRRHSDGSPVPVGMIFIPCLAGISHNPAEFASEEDLARGAEVLMETLYGLASK
ncbi:MAG: Zn-dependent hydrolase [Treponemataceae bacterium]